jgi:EmrB/QacA subfamily drug resistance transporter
MSGMSRHRSVALVLCCLAQFMAVLDVSIANVGLARIRADLGFSTAGLQWVVNAYTLGCAGFLLLGGRAADVFGRRQAFVGGVTLFGLASLVGGLAQDQAMLIAARAGQGIGGAVMAPTSLSIIATLYEEGPRRNRAFGLWGTMGALGGASGALVGGVLITALSWRWVLLVNAPLALAVALAARRAIPAVGRPSGAARSFDLPGAFTVTVALVLVTYGIVGSRGHGWAAPATLGPLAAGIALLGLFGVIEATLAPSPLVPLRILRSRALSGAAVVIFCLGGAAIPMWFFVSLYMQQVLGRTAMQAGLTFLPMSLTIVACTQLASRLAHRLGPGRVLATGMTLLGVGMLLFSRIDADGSWATDVLAPSLLCAAGIGCSFVSTTIAANTGVAREDSGLASGLINTSFQIGGSIGLAVLATIAAGRTAAATGGVTEAVALTGGFQRAFAAGGGFALAGAAMAVAVLTPRASETVRSGKRVDPALEPAHFTRQDVGVAERVGEKGGALHAGEERGCQVARIPAAHLAKLPLRPIEDEPEQARGLVGERAVLLVELGAEASDRAAVSGDELGDVGPRAREPLEACARRRAPVE